MESRDHLRLEGRLNIKKKQLSTARRYRTINFGNSITYDMNYADSKRMNRLKHNDKINYENIIRIMMTCTDLEFQTIF